MSRSEPPRLAVALLHRFIPDNEPLVGDLLEGFSIRQSRLWLWREVLAAIVIRALQPPDRAHPLGLTPAGMDGADEPSRAARRRTINLTASPLPGIGGLGLFALVVIVALAGARVWWIFVPALAGGAGLGLALTLIRRRAVLSRPAATRRILTTPRDDAGHGS
jgi:hypothetical protein